MEAFFFYLVGIVLVVGGIFGSIHYKKVDFVFGRGHAPAELVLLPMLLAVAIEVLWLASRIFGS